jgi:hypothetical protein
MRGVKRLEKKEKKVVDKDVGPPPQSEEGEGMQ